MEIQLHAFAVSQENAGIVLKNLTKKSFLSYFCAVFMPKISLFSTTSFYCVNSCNCIPVCFSSQGDKSDVIAYIKRCFCRSL